jgi:hypothetical protein
MKKQVLLAALLLGSALTATAQEPIFSQDFEGDPAELFDEGWQITVAAGTTENFGIFNPIASIEALGFTGHTIGATTFDIVNQVPVNIPETDIIITTPFINLPTGITNLRYRVGSLGVGAGTSSHYSTYILTQEELEPIETVGELTALLDSKDADDSATVSGESFTSAFTLTEYGGGLIMVAFRLHDSPSNSALLFDDIKISEGSLGTGSGLTADMFSVYPNPTQNFVNINGNNSVSFESITITDLNGRTVATKKMNGTNSGKIDISTLSAGIYVMTIASDQGTATKKIIKQ